MKIHDKNEFCTRLVPILAGIINCLAHLPGFYMYTQGRCSDSYQVYHGVNKCPVEDLQVEVTININDLVRQIVLLGIFFLNHVYLDIFLTVT